MNARDYALEILQARASGRTLPAISSRTELKLELAYEIAKNIDEIRKGLGEHAIGRSLSLSRNTPHGDNALATLRWTTLFDATVRYLPSNVCLQSLEGAMRPMISAVVIFKLATTPDAEASLEQLLDCVEWLAHGIEIMSCPYPGGEISEADEIAALGLHGTLLIAQAHPLSQASRAQLGQVLANACISLSCDGSLIAAGYGSKVLDSPVHALGYLHQQLKRQTQFPPLQAGEIISTGSWVVPMSVQAGQTWSSAFSGLDLAGISISFV
jgi:2-keto-4-pentenoate hydratase